MNLRERARRAHPDFAFLDVNDPDGVAHHMRALGWLEPDDRVIACAPAGAGNMNLTLRIETRRRIVVLKQARPWVEKYDEIPAPWDRARSEIAFYRAVASIPDVRARMPRILESDSASRTLLLEYLPGTGDFSDLYDHDRALAAAEIEAAADYLATLHRETRKSPDPALANREMRALNHAHIYEIPLARDNGLDLDAHEPGLARAARALSEDRRYREAVADTARRYLADGPCLLHGDYFPGSWLRADAGFRVIDPEFAFRGDPEFDVGCAVAHFALAGQAAEAARSFLARYRSGARDFDLDAQWLGRYAGAEVMRRLIGVAQLPIPQREGSTWRRDLLARSREAVLHGDSERLFGTGSQVEG